MKIGAELQRKLGVACTVPVGFAVVLLNGLWSFFFFFPFSHSPSGSP